MATGLSLNDSVNVKDTSLGPPSKHRSLRTGAKEWLLVFMELTLSARYHAVSSGKARTRQMNGTECKNLLEKLG